MTTLSAEVLNDSAAVRLTIGALSGLSSIVRTDANGSTDVRTLPGILDTLPPVREDLRNLIQTSTAATGWVASRAALTVVSGRLRGTADGTGSAYIYYTGWTAPAGGGRLPVTPGVPVSVRADVRQGPNGTAGENGIQARVALQWYDAAGASIGGQVYGASRVVLPVIVGGAPTVSVSAVPPANAVSAYVLFYWYTSTGGVPTNGIAADFENVAVYKGQTGADLVAAGGNNYFNGSTLDTDVYRYDWAGAAGASESTRSVQDSPFVIYDYEAADGPLRYDVTNGAGTLTSLDVAGFKLAGPWLFAPVVPGYSRRVLAVTGISTAFADNSTVLDGLFGRPDPIVIMRPLGMRSGTLEIYAGNYAAALDLLSPVRQGTVLMLRQPEHDGMDMYFAAAGGTPEIVSLVTNAGETVFGVRVPFVEVRRPEGPLAGALGWTFADLAAAGPTFYSIKRAYATFADLRLNKRKA